MHRGKLCTGVRAAVGQSGMPAFFSNDPAFAPTGVRALLAALDWRAHPLGHPDTWPPELATAVRMSLDSAFPMFVAWGRSCTCSITTPTPR